MVMHMIYEIWTDYGTDSQNCYSITDNIISAEQYYRSATNNGSSEVSVMVFDLDSESPLYELNFDE